jgi:hypothetical protein
VACAALVDSECCGTEHTQVSSPRCNSLYMSPMFGTSPAAVRIDPGIISQSSHRRNLGGQGMQALDTDVAGINDKNITHRANATYLDAHLHTPMIGILTSSPPPLWNGFPWTRHNADIRSRVWSRILRQNGPLGSILNFHMRPFITPIVIMFFHSYMCTLILRLDGGGRGYVCESWLYLYCVWHRYAVYVDHS